MITIEQIGLKQLIKCGSCDCGIGYYIDDIQHGEILDNGEYFATHTWNYIICPQCKRRVIINEYIGE